MSLADFFTFDAETAAAGVLIAMMSCPTQGNNGIGAGCGRQRARHAILRER